jgi:hypothetical protein
MQLNRRRFLFATPAIVAASSLMPLSVKAAAFIMPSKNLYVVSGFDAYGRPISEQITHSHMYFTMGVKQFKIITSVAFPDAA